MYINDIYVYITFNFVQLIAELCNAHMGVGVIDGGEGCQVNEDAFTDSMKWGDEA